MPAMLLPLLKNLRLPSNISTLRTAFNTVPNLKIKSLVLCQCHLPVCLNTHCTSKKVYSFHQGQIHADMDAKPQTTEDVTNSEIAQPDDSNLSDNQRTIELDLSKSNQGIGSEPLSKRALKRQERAKRHKELKKQRKAKNLIQTGREEAGYSLKDFDNSSYYFENGLRKVYPYHYVFATHAKGRWIGRQLREVLGSEFGFDQEQPDYLSKSFETGKIHVNNASVSPDYIIKDCDYISHQVHRHENHVTGVPLEMLEDNDDVVVINKPASIPCHPCGRYRFNSIVFILGKEYGYANLRNIYRLDRLTSGVLILGKSAKATKVLEDQVQNRQVQKEYVCRVEGEFPSGELTVDQPLDALSNKLRLRIVSAKGKPSQTTFHRLSFNGKTSIVKCIPHTGRTHQIRVHLQYLGHPIVNDVFYNSFAWGPNKGKEGQYLVPFKTVCERIAEIHHASQWEGGENLSDQRLQGEDQEPASLEEGSMKSNIHVSEGNVRDKIDVANVSHDSKQNGNSRAEETSSYEPPAKQRKPDEIEKGEMERSASQPQNSEGCYISSAVSAGQAENQKNQEATLASCSQAEISGGPSVRLSVDGSDGLERHPAFDSSLWTVDASCASCQKTTIDPQPKDLVMFLHALKYKGPGWEYQTALPHWAEEDWNDEANFGLDISPFAEDTTVSGC